MAYDINPRLFFGIYPYYRYGSTCLNYLVLSNFGTYGSSSYKRYISNATDRTIYDPRFSRSSFSTH